MANQPAKRRPSAAGSAGEKSTVAVDIAGQISKLERRHFELEGRVEDLADTMEQTAGEVTQALRALRGELLGDRRALATSAIFAAVTPALDALGAMRAEPDLVGDAAVSAQIRATAGALANLLQTLGFSTFECEPGVAFDAARMEVLGYGDGNGDGVLAAVRPGYMAGDAVVRPAGVLVADPSGAASAHHGADAAHQTQTTGGPP